MAIDAISGSAPLSTLSRPPETTPSARESAAQENDARRTAEAVQGAAPSTQSRPQEPAESLESVGPRSSVVPASNSAELSYQDASQALSRANGNGEQPSAAEMRAASEAYRAESAARDQFAQAQQQGGVRSADVMA